MYSASIGDARKPLRKASVPGDGSKQVNLDLEGEFAEDMNTRAVRRHTSFRFEYGYSTHSFHSGPPRSENFKGGKFHLVQPFVAERRCKANDRTQSRLI